MGEWERRTLIERSVRNTRYGKQGYVNGRSGGI